MSDPGDPPPSAPREAPRQADSADPLAPEGPTHAANLRPGKKRRPYAPPAIIHEEAIESVAVACDPASNPGLPVKAVDGDPNGAGGFCQYGFLNS